MANVAPKRRHMDRDGQARKYGDEMSYMHEAQAHNEATFGEFGRRINVLERGFQNLQGEMHHGFSEISKGFADFKSEVKTALSSLDASRGPGFGKISAVALTVVSIVALLCGGIIWFVSSIVAPDTTKLEQMNSHQNTLIEKFDADREAELTKLRQAREQREEERIRRLEERLGWVPQDITRER